MGRFHLHAGVFSEEGLRPVNTNQQGVVAAPAAPGGVPRRAGAGAAGGTAFAIALSLVAAVRETKGKTLEQMQE